MRLSDDNTMVDFGQFELPRSKRRLVEECSAISIHAVQRSLGKPALLRAIREAQPIHVPVPYHPGFDVYLTSLPQPMVGNPSKSFDRLYLVCPGCLRRVAKLFHNVASDLRCRHCHSLTYHSQNCSGNKWYREVAVPLKRLYRRREKLLAACHRPESQERLEEVSRQICFFKKQVHPRRPNRNVRRMSLKRQYRDLRLLE
jgi:hypothetical protein